MFCENCGSKLLEGSKFCMNCGEKARVEENFRETAIEEAATSTDTSVIEAVPAAVDKEAAEITEVKPEKAQHGLPGQGSAVESNAAQAAQPITGQTEDLKPTAVQQAPDLKPAATQPAAPQTAQQATPQQTPTKTATIPTQAAMPSRIQQAIPVKPDAAQDIRNSATAQNKQFAAPQGIQNTAVPQYMQQPSSPALQEETELKPEKFKPLQTWKFIGMLLLTGIPLVNLIMVLIWSFSNGFNKNTKSFARAVLILWIVGLVLLIAGAILNWALFQDIWSSISSMTSDLSQSY